MITIQKGEHKLVCSEQTYENQFKSLGYQIASEKKEATKKVVSSLDNQEKNNKEDNELTEKYGLTTKRTRTSKKGK